MTFEEAKVRLAAIINSDGIDRETAWQTWMLLTDTRDKNCREPVSMGAEDGCVVVRWPDGWANCQSDGIDLYGTDSSGKVVDHYRRRFPSVEEVEKM